MFRCNKSFIAICCIVGGYVLFWVLTQQRFLLYGDNSCLFKKITQVPCPGCGMGRASIQLLEGNWIQACKLHILSIPFHGMVGLVCIGLCRDVFCNKNTCWHLLCSGIPKKYYAVLYGMLLATWGMQIYRAV